MELINSWINGINEILWSYILIILLLGCAVWFSFKTHFVQFRMIREMIRVLGDSTNKAHKGEKQISSFQAFAVSLASRVGTGNLAGVATAIAVGGRELSFGCGSSPCWVHPVPSSNRLWHSSTNRKGKILLSEDLPITCATDWV